VISVGRNLQIDPALAVGCDGGIEIDFADQDRTLLPAYLNVESLP